MRQSEIFAEFEKIAREKGLVADPKAPEKAKKILENNPRWDSQTAEEIAKLYDLKIDRPKDQDYEKNIAERAHKDPVIVSPSYDRLNGLVENVNERQNIILNIVNKNNNGQLTNHKWAEQQLVLSLVRIGNDMDNRDQEELRILADSCLSQIAVKKQAAAPLLIGAVAAVIGALWVQQHLDFVDEGFERNHQKLISELDDMLSSNADWGVGVSYKATFIKMLQDFKSKLNEFYGLYKKITPVISDLDVPDGATDLLNVATKPQSQAVIKAYQALKLASEKMVPYIEGVMKNFKNEGYKLRQIEEKGFLTELVDKLQAFHGGKGLVSDDFDDVVRAIPPYLKSITDLQNILSQAGQYEEKAAQDLSPLVENEMSEIRPVSPAKHQEKLDDLGRELDDLLNV